MEFKCAKCGSPIGPNSECFIGESGPLCVTCLKCGMVYHALKSLDLVRAAKYAIVATDIQWDVDEAEDLDKLPTEIPIPNHVWKEYEDGNGDAVSDYITDLTGYCHGGFTLRNPMMEEAAATFDAILVELDYKGSYQRFALTPEEFKVRYPETYKTFGPIEESNSDTLKPMVHIWFQPCNINDDKWTTFFSDMEDGLPQSDIDCGNLAEIRLDEFGELIRYIGSETYIKANSHPDCDEDALLKEWVDAQKKEVD